MSSFLRACAITAGMALSASAFSQINITGPWVRSTVPGQSVAAAYMDISSPVGVALVRGSSPAAKSVEIHEMRMEGSVMKMREVPRIDVPAGKTVRLRPGSYHVMLIDILKPIQKGDIVPISLVFEQAGKPAQTVTIKAEVRDTMALHQHEMKH